METQMHEDQEPRPDEDHGKLVKVTIDGNPRNIRRGRYLVSELKDELGVPAEYELDLVVNGELKALTDNEHIVIEGGETFVSHVRRGGAS